jgi:hypothetical protein
MFLQDNRIIQRHGQLAVHAQRFEVMWRDGTAVHLHPVSRAIPEVFLRALQLEGLRWLVFDLSHLVPSIEADLIRLDQRDHPGCVFFTLRLRYANAQAFVAAAADAATARWWPTEPTPDLGERLALA